jgi:exopolysaccharide biosynthesis polyprenyl glycosylphosphotransferase
MSKPQLPSVELPVAVTPVAPIPASAPAGPLPARRASSTRSPDPLRRRLLAAADTVAVLLACVVLSRLADAETGLWLAACLPVWLVLAKLTGLYDRDHRALRHLTVDELPTIVLWATVSTAVTVSLIGATPADTVGAPAALAVLATAAVGAASLRALARLTWRRLTPPERALMIGRPALTEAIRRKLELFPDIHVTVIGEREDVRDDELTDRQAWLDGVDRAIVAADGIDPGALDALVALCRREGVKLSVIPPSRGLFGTTVQLTHIADLPIVECMTWDFSRSTLLLKRSLDLALAVPLLVLTAPLMAVLAVAVRLDSHGPALFVQRRAGLAGRPFSMMKFRTMTDGAEARLPELIAVDKLEQPMFKLRDDPRVTRVGHWLRRASLDELPQLVNVVRGEMSLVGPRPEQMDLVARYREEHLFRLAVKPGLTGPMQVYGRGDLTFEERLAVEREYVENLSISRDLRILALTLAVVAGGDGAF